MKCLHHISRKAILVLLWCCILSLHFQCLLSEDSTKQSPEGNNTKNAVADVKSVSKNNSTSNLDSSDNNKNTSTTTLPEITTVNCTVTKNDTRCNTTSVNSSGDKPLFSNDDEGVKTYFGINVENFEMYKRAFYVIVAVTAIVVVYLGVKMYM